jgi:hypothetical protein
VIVRSDSRSLDRCEQAVGDTAKCVKVERNVNLNSQVMLVVIRRVEASSVLEVIVDEMQNMAIREIK